MKEESSFARITNALNEAFARLEAYLHTELSDDQVRTRMREQLVRATLRVYTLARKINEEQRGPSLHAVIVGISPETAPQEAEQGAPALGTKVRIEASRNDDASIVGRTGYVLGDPDPHGDIMVALENGDVGFFNVGTERADREFSVVPQSTKRIILAIDGRVVDVTCPDDVAYKVGSIVRIEATTNAILGIVDAPASGDVTIVKKVLAHGRFEVKRGDGTCVVPAGSLRDTLTIGRRVLVDRSYSAIIEDLGDPDTDFHLSKPTGVSWSDIGGLEDAKEALQDTIDLPNDATGTFTYYNGTTPKGILLIGPPGGGKGMLANAYVTALGVRFGEPVPRGFISVKGPEILKGIVGSSEEVIRDIFAEGNRLYDELGYSVVFVDEIDAVGKKRGTGVSMDIFDTIVPAFLTELNGFRGTFIAATNRVDILDPALIRSGRIDLKIVVPRPDRAAAEKIFRVHLRNVPTQEVPVDALAQAAAELLFSDEFAFFKIALEKKTDAEEQRVLLFNLGHVTSGAMIEAIVSAAKRIAIKRDVAASKRTGVSIADVSTAIKKEYEQNLPLDHTEAVREFVQNLTDKVAGIYKLHQRKG